jgi:hypothetical protein
MESNGGIMLTGKTKELGEKPVPLPLYLTPHTLTTEEYYYYYHHHHFLSQVFFLP